MLSPLLPPPVNQFTSKTTTSTGRAAASRSCRDPGSVCVNGSSGCGSAVTLSDHQGPPGQFFYQSRAAEIQGTVKPIDSTDRKILQLLLLTTITSPGCT